jgi:hypothetical protein
MSSSKIRQTILKRAISRKTVTTKQETKKDSMLKNPYVYVPIGIISSIVFINNYDEPRHPFRTFASTMCVGAFWPVAVPVIALFEVVTIHPRKK